MPIKWQPFKDLDQFKDDNMFDEDEQRQQGGWVPFMPSFPTHRPQEPMMDVYQDKNNLYVEIPLPGVKPENVNISIEDNVLSISGKMEEKKELKETDYLRREVRKGSFRRVVKLPVEVKGDKASAEFSNGVLKIAVPKAAKPAAPSKRIPIKVK